MTVDRSAHRGDDDHRQRHVSKGRAGGSTSTGENAERLLPAELDCYLEIARFFSLVFPDGMTRANGELILQNPAKAPPLVVFKQQLLAAWLNFANGAIKLDTPVVTSSNKTAPPDTTFGAAILVAEMVAINPSVDAGADPGAERHRRAYRPSGRRMRIEWGDGCSLPLPVLFCWRVAGVG